MLLENEKFTKYLEQNFEYIESQFANDPATELTPTLMIVRINDKDEVTTDMATFLEFDENRYKMMFNLGGKYGLSREKVIAAYLTSEGWMSRQTEEERNAHPDNRIQPSEDPDRIEVVFVFGMALDLSADGISATIHRDKDGRFCRLERHQVEMQGIESDLLKAFFGGFAKGYSIWMNTKNK